MNITENSTFKQLYVTTGQGIEYRIPKQYRADFLAFIGATGQTFPLNDWHSPNTQAALEQYGERITPDPRQQLTIFDALGTSEPTTSNSRW
ncbi:hypothetical protein [Leptothoe sp. PORK10 BA2]|uniref:hypothetical protein n=1 Tax=Leptothoe sp. PORK10 BA2 TaxID=3110254 RepID=UPI002B2078C2|nr:hypothetical protein [Leptothoe sp. PORK10 BA2]MEA5464615.1 hypothetical protein [Leptothoe sp. PORK10 BA2]